LGVAEALVDLEQLNIDDPLLNLSEDELWALKADYVKSLYWRGVEYATWTDERAKWWFESLTFFVDEFIQPKLERPKFHDNWYWWMVREAAYLNLAPRDHAKTSCHAVFRVVWEICCNRNIRYLLALATQDVAKLVLNDIKSQLEQNPRIKAGFGSFNPAELDADERKVPLDWSQVSITVNRDDFSIKDPTVGVVGAMTQVLSRRADRLIADDLVTDKVAYSEAESARLLRWYYSDINPVLVAEGQEIITGTLYRRGDFYHNIMAQSIDEGGLYRVFVGDAIVDEAERKVLWPERWSYENLLKQRQKLGAVQFNRNYRNRIVSDADSPFPMIWFEGGEEPGTNIVYRGCYDYTLLLGRKKETGNRRWLRYIVIGVDPAIGETKASKFFGLVVVGLDYQGRIIVADIIRGQFNFVAQKRIITEAYDKWKPRYIVVESNSYQKALLEGLQEDVPYLPVIPYYTSGQRQKPDVGVPAMDVFFETGRVRVPRGDAASIKMTDKFVEELHYWGKYDTSDLAMAFWFAFQRLLPEIERFGAMPPARDLIFGDRQRWESSMVRGIGGHILPRRTIKQIQEMAMGAPFGHMSPSRKREKV